MWEIDAFTRPVDPMELVRAFGFLVAGAVVGYALYRVLLARVRGGNTLTSWGGDRIILGAVHDVVLVWFTSAGAALAVTALPFDGAVAGAIRRGLLAIVVASGTWVAARLTADLVRMFSLRSGTAGKGSSIFLNVARVTIFLVGGLVLLQTFGVRIGPLLAALGVGGLAIALALQEPLRNFFAGLQLLATRKVRPGHYVRLESGEEGYIMDIDWRHTSIRELPDNMVLVPNTKLADAIITNFDYPDRETSLIVQVSVHYKSDLDHVERVTVDVANDVMETVDGGVPGSAPFIRYHTFADFSIDLSVILRIRDIVSQHLVKHEFLKRLKSRYGEEGITIPFPTISHDPSSPPDGRERRQHRTTYASSDRS